MINQFSHTNSTFSHPSIIQAAKNRQYYTSANTHVSTCQSAYQQFDDIESSRTKMSNLRKSKVSLAAIRQKLKDIKITEAKRQKSGLDKVLQLLREQRQSIAKLKQQKRNYLAQVWKNFGSLMALDKQKIQTDLMSQPNNQIKQKLYNQLVSKNEYNLKSSKNFNKKIQNKSAHCKLHQTPVFFKKNELNFQKCHKAEQNQINECKENSTNENMTLDRKQKSLQLQKIAYNTCRPQIRPRPMPFRVITNRSSQECQNDQIKAKVESTFKSIKKNELHGKNILNPIVFDPDHVFCPEKRKYYFKNLQKRQYNRFDKKQISKKVLLRVGGMRLSLQDNRFCKTIKT